MKAPRTFPLLQIRRPVLISAAASLALLRAEWNKSAWACVGCGLTESFTPKMLLVSTGFVLLPASIVGLLWWRLRNEAKSSNQRSQK